MFWTCIMVEIVDDVTQPQKRKGEDVRTKYLAWSASLTFCAQGEISVVCFICACATSLIHVNAGCSTRFQLSRGVLAGWTTTACRQVEPSKLRLVPGQIQSFVHSEVSPYHFMCGTASFAIASGYSVLWALPHPWAAHIGSSCQSTWRRRGKNPHSAHPGSRLCHSSQELRPVSLHLQMFGLATSGVLHAGPIFADKGLLEPACTCSAEPAGAQCLASPTLSATQGKTASKTAFKEVVANMESNLPPGRTLRAKAPAKESSPASEELANLS